MLPVEKRVQRRSTMSRYKLFIRDYYISSTQTCDAYGTMYYTYGTMYYTYGTMSGDSNM